jgi:hypothetical protein
MAGPGLQLPVRQIVAWLAEPLILSSAFLGLTKQEITILWDFVVYASMFLRSLIKGFLS